MEQKREKRKACNRDGAKERGRGRHSTEMEIERKRKAFNRDRNRV